MCARCLMIGKEDLCHVDLPEELKYKLESLFDSGDLNKLIIKND